MVRLIIFAAVAIIGITTASAQFYDLYQALQPLVQSYPTFTEQHDRHTTKRPKTTIRQKTQHNEQRNANRQNPIAISTLESPIRDDLKRNEYTIAPNHQQYDTTSKPRKSKPSNQSNGRSSTRNTSREIGRKQTRPSSSIIVYEEPVYETNIFGRRPEKQETTKTNRKNVQTTQNPFYNRPGVKPAPVDHRQPPITNRPQTERPSRVDAIQFPVDREDQVSPELIIGPNEDSMSDVEKRRYVELSERICDKYKNLYTKQLQAIPLVPSPEPLEINITSCVPSTIPLVVGGKVVSIREFPHMALIGWQKLQTSGYAWRCGGSLISDQFVLTAAHCAFDERDNNIIMGTPRVVQLGSSYLDDPGALVVKVASVIRHPKYKQPSSYYDIALIKLATAVTFSEVLRPACLGVPPSSGDSIIATGWGRTEFGGKQSKELRSVSIPIWGQSECYDVLGTSRRLPSGPDDRSQMCAGERMGGKDTCQGDSGGPAQVQDGCVWRVVAITSLGRACGAPNTPALYAKVQRAFIASVAFGKIYRGETADGGRPAKNGGANNQNNRNGETYGVNGDSNQYSNRYTTERSNGVGTANQRNRFTTERSYGINQWDSYTTERNGVGQWNANRQTALTNNGGGTNRNTEKPSRVNDNWNTNRQNDRMDYNPQRNNVNHNNDYNSNERNNNNHNLNNNTNKNLNNNNHNLNNNNDDDAYNRRQVYNDQAWWS